MEFDNGCASPSADREPNYNASDAEESDANADDEHGHDTAEDQEREVQASQPCGPRRRNRKIAKWPTDQIVVTVLTKDGMPTEDKAVNRMRKLAGLIARQRLSLLMHSFKDLSDEDKKHLFDECVQPSLKFVDKLRATALKVMMRIVNKSWRTFKSELVRNFVSKGLNAREKHPFILHQEWETFVALQDSDEVKKKSEKFKKLRERNKHNHCLGTTGYARAAKRWEKQDSELAAKGISNPWHKYPEGRPRSYLRGRSNLVISESSAKIQWVSESTERVSQQVVEKQTVLESLELTDTWVRDKDVLSQVLGPEQTGRIRGHSSYSGWKYWPNCSNMYRKRKHSDSDLDVDAIKDQLREEITKDVIAMLREQGVNLVLPSNTLPSVGGMKGCCGSALDAVGNNVQLDRPGGNSNPNPVDLVTEETFCTLVSRPGGYLVEVGRGKVFPKQTEIYSVPVQDGYVVVHVNFVYPEHESFVLSLPPAAEVTTLGEAMHKRVQWRKDDILISPKDISAKKSLEPTLIGRSAKYSLNDFECNVSSSQNEKASAPTVGNCASKEHAEGNKESDKSTRGPARSSAASRAPKSNTKRDQQVGVKQQQEAEPSAPTVGNRASKEHAEGKKQSNKYIRGPAGSSAASRPPKSTTKRNQQVGVKQQQQEAEPTKLQVGVRQQQEAEPTKLSSTHVASVWIRPNSKFKFGMPMLSPKEIEKAGPGCAALHAYYMNACVENRNTGILGRMEQHYLCSELDSLTVGFEDLFDLLTLDGLDVAILRVITLYLIVQARDKSVPVVLLDPAALSINTLIRNRDYSVEYLETSLRKCAQEKYVMFAHNCGGHWIAVIIITYWNKVFYIDSNRGGKTDLSLLKSVIDEAYGNIQSKALKTKIKLTHATKVPCLQQGLDNTCGFYAAHHLMLAMVQMKDLKNYVELDMQGIRISLKWIREAIALFIMSEIVDQNGEFHDPTN